LIAFVPIEELLPHRGSMLLLTSMVDADAESATCEATPDANAWYADTDGTMPAWIGIELMAQTIAVHVALIARRAGRLPRPGVLLGTRAYRADADRFPAGQPLQVSARSTHRDAAGLGAYDCSLTDGRGRVLATAAITVYEPDDFAQFLATQVHGEAQ